MEPVRRGAAGQVLVEVLVALVLIFLTLALSIRLLAGSQVLLMEAAREARDPVLPVVIRQLRHDIQGASDVVPVLSGGSSQPLALTGNPQGRITYRRTPELHLQREVQTAAGTIRRDLLHGVVGWKWIEIQAGLVQIELTVRRQPGRGNPLAATPESLHPAPLEEVQYLRFALRGGGRVHGW